MRNRLLPVLSAFVLALTPDAGAAQTALQLRWELTADSQATFTLTNRDTKPLPASGWAIYFSALHSADSGSVGAGFAIQDVLGDLHRIVPGAGFAGLAPGATVKIPYVTQPLRNRRFAPAGPYLVFDSAKDVGVPLSDYLAAPFERSHDVVTPEAQFALDSAISDVPASELPPVFPTPLQVTKGTGELRLGAPPQITAGADLANEATFAADYLRPYFRAGRKGTVPPPPARRSRPAGAARRGRPPLRLPRVHARRRPQLPGEAGGAAHPRSPRPLQAQRLPHALDR